jgi:anti-anti-sigma factor
MSQTEVKINLRKPAGGVGILDIQGEISGSAEESLMTAYEQASSGGAQIIGLNFAELESLDSFGVGLLIKLLADIRRRNQRPAAYGLAEAYQQIFELTQLDEALELYADESEMLRSVAGSGIQIEAPVSEPEVMRTIRQRGRWARPVDRLDVPDLPKEAMNINVRGRHLTGPVRGFGQLWRRTYAIRLTGATATPAEVIQVWRERFASFWPPGNHFYGAERPIEAGDVAVLNLAGPGGMPVATGLMVIYADEETFCFMGAAGHMFGGMITFSARKENGATVAQVQALLRGSDPLYEITFRIGLGAKAEDEFWKAGLTNLAAYLGVQGQPVEHRTELLDPSMQWSRATNIWYNAAIRTTLYLPVHWIRRLGSK